MPHQLHERLLVRFQRCLGQRRQRIEQLAVGGDHAREALVVQLDPGRRVVGSVVLPRGEPQQHQPQFALARLRQQGVEEGEVERAFLGLDLFPGDRHHHRIGLEHVDRRPDLLQHRRVVARVVDLRAEDQERFAVDQQGVASVLGDQLGNRRFGGVLGLRRRLRGSGSVVRRGRRAGTGGDQHEHRGEYGTAQACAYSSSDLCPKLHHRISHRTRPLTTLLCSSFPRRREPRAFALRRLKVAG